MATAQPFRPNVGFCVQTESTGSNQPCRWYLNMCRHSLVEMPVAYSGKVVSRDYILTHGLGNLQVPFDIGAFRKLKARSDGAKQTTYCIDAVFNPLIIQLFMDDEFCSLMSQFRSFVINLVVNRIEESVGVKLSTQTVKLVKSLRYKDGEEGSSDIAREFTELPGDKDSFDAEMPRQPEPEPGNEPVPLIEDVTPGVARRKPALKKGFFNQNAKPLYGPGGSSEGVLPENAGEPMGWMPKKLRQQCKIVDCNSPDYQAQEKEKRAAESHNEMQQEFRETLKKDMDKWCNTDRSTQWAEDLPDGTDVPQSKYDVDYTRFDSIDDVEECTQVEKRDWYYDSKGERRLIDEPPSKDQEHKVSSLNQMKRGFLDATERKALYPTGSEQAKAPPSEEQLMKELFTEMKSASPGGGAAAPAGATQDGVVAKVPDSRTPDFQLRESGDDAMQLVVSVPRLESMQDVKLDVTERSATLAFPPSAGLKPLQVELPKEVIPTRTTAKFSKKRCELTVTLPLAS